jgi:ribosomal protein L11 methyltransferase
MDYILELSWPPERRDLDDRVETLLFLTSTLGSRISERSGQTVVACYFASPEDRSEARAALSGVEGIEIHELDEEKVDWLDLYRQSLEPLFIGERFVVAPDAGLIPEGDPRLRIIIPQERAFGTGSHESTSMCLAMLERLDLRGKAGLDIGSGSGILAIGMIRLGARVAFAFDNDLETWEVLPKNLERNGVGEGAIPFFVGGVDAVRREPRFDVITMNILPFVIIPNLPAVAQMLAPGGSLVVSGIILQHREEVLEAAGSAGLELRDESSSGDWWCGRLTGAT